MTLTLTTNFSPPRCLLMAPAAAPIAAYTELISHDGNDTVTVAFAPAAGTGVKSPTILF